MPLPTTRFSRLDFRYLAPRYAGVTFMLLALGFLVGLAYRLMLQPVLYTSHAEVSMTVEPPDSAPRYDWSGKEAEWRRFLTDNRSDWGLLSVNLRHAVKLAVTEGREAEGRELQPVLAEFEGGKEYSASLFRNRFLWRLGPVLRVGRGDLARYLDFQSLARIIADLQPPAGSEGWDFSFFDDDLRERLGTGVVAQPDADDVFFKVFFRLHELRQGRPAVNAHAAWRAAVNELDERLERESAYASGGGFGPVATRELLREIEAIPVLAANCLYHANGWFAGDDEFSDLAAVWARHWVDDAVLNVLPHGRGGAVLSAGFNLELRPVMFPRDTVLTRIAPLAAATLINFVHAREGLSEGRSANGAVIAAPPETSPHYVAELPELPAAPSREEPAEAMRTAVAQEETAEPEFIEVYDEVAGKQRLSLIAMHEESVRMARVERDAALRRLYAARADSNRVSHEAIAARARVDKLRERYDLMAAEDEAQSGPVVPAETAELFRKRDDLLQRLVSLREYCTEEHPFVKLALRELRVVEGLLIDHSPDATANRNAEARATRLANLYLEWETAAAQADSLEERARRHEDEVRCFLNDVTELEQCISRRETELAQAKESPVPVLRIEAPRRQAPRLRPPEPEPVVAVTRPEPAPAPVPAPAPEVVPHIVFARLPLAIEQKAHMPDWRSLWWGLGVGAALSLLWAVLREVFAGRFRSVGEARRLVGLPVLASLPEYSRKSVQKAAETMKGELMRTRPGRWQFIPMPVEAVEPPAEGRRGKITSARLRLRWWPWAAGVLFVLLSGLVYYRALTGFAPPIPGKFGPLSLPSETVPAWAQEDEVWGDQP